MRLRYQVLALLCGITVIVLIALPSFAQSRGGHDADAAVEEDPLEHPLPPGIKVRAFIHRPRVVEPAHLGTCLPDNPTTPDTNYGLTGWHLSGSIRWRLNPSTVPSSVGASAARAAIDAAFDAWTAADASKVFIDGGNTTAKGARFDGVNAILWKRIGASSIAVTYVWYYTATGQVAEVDTIFNSRYPWRVFPTGDGCSTLFDAYDVLNIGTHEFGHWIGLDDLYNDADRDLTMYGFGAGGELKKRSLAAGDADGANAVAP